jgi:hypothetical protein
MHIRLSLCLALASLLAPLPLAAQNQPPQVLQWDKTDLGPFHTGTFKVKEQRTVKGIAIKVGTNEAPATVLFDPELLRVSAAWTGGFLKFPRGRGGLEGQITPDGQVLFSTSYAPGWGKGEIGEDPRPRNQGQLPADVAKWRGLYLTETRCSCATRSAPRQCWSCLASRKRARRTSSPARFSSAKRTRRTRSHL